MVTASLPDAENRLFVSCVLVTVQPVCFLNSSNRTDRF